MANTTEQRLIVLKVHDPSSPADITPQLKKLDFWGEGWTIQNVSLRAGLGAALKRACSALQAASERRCTGGSAAAVHRARRWFSTNRATQRALPER